MRIIHVPIEPYPNRYTEEWCQQFETEFCETGVEYMTIPGDLLNEKIITGCVLDACGTHVYKFSQLNRIIRMINDGAINNQDVIFFSDLWFPGLESLFYIRNISEINFKIGGILHAGTWDPHDFTSRTGMRNWGQHLELSWLNDVDMIFVATQWHKDLIVMNSGSFDKDKIHVTGLPFYSEKLAQKYPVEKKDNIVVFPHRTDIEKHPEKFDRLARKYPQWRFIKTIESTSSRDEYFQLLARSKVMISFADQETFGYSTLEAMALENHVIVPDALSYREIVPYKHYRYSNEKEIPEMLEDFMKKDIPMFGGLKIWEHSIGNMILAINEEMEVSAQRRKDREVLIQQEQARVAQEKADKKQARKDKKGAQ